MLILLQKSKIKIYEKSFFKIALFLSKICLLCSSLSLPETYYQKWRNILLVACTTFPPTFEKTSFSTKNNKKICTSNNKTRQAYFLECVSISWNQKWFLETTTEWCSCEKKKKIRFLSCWPGFFQNFSLDILLT